MKHNFYNDLRIKKGNVYFYLEDDVKEWLIDEAFKLNKCEIGLVIASIVKDAYAEESSSL